MTDEGKRDTEKWIEKTSASYPYAYDKGGKLAREFGVSGIPHSVLIDPAGKIVWSGHPMSLDPGMLTTHLAGALPFPMWEWPKSMSKVKNHLLKQQYGKALAAANKLTQEDQSLGKFEQAIQSIVKSKIDQVTARLDAGDYLGAQQQSLALKKELKGLPEAMAADQALESIAKHKEAKSIIKAQKSLAKLKSQPVRKKGDVKKLIRKIQRLATKFPGTFVEAQAHDIVAELEQRALSLR